MSNAIFLEAVTVVSSNMVKSYGFTMFDDYERIYVNHRPIEEVDPKVRSSLYPLFGDTGHEPLPSEELNRWLWDYAAEADDTCALRDEALRSGLYIEGCWYASEDLAKLTAMW